MAQPRDVIVNVHLHIQPDGTVIDQSQLDRIEATLARIEIKETQQMADLSALTTEVTENGDVIDSAVALLGSLAQQVRDLSTDPEALQALADQLDSQSGELAAAVAANTPAAPDPGPDEPPVDEPPVEDPAPPEV